MWLELSKSSQDRPTTSWLWNKTKCSDCHMLIPFNTTSDEVQVKGNVACYLSGCHRFEGWPLQACLSDIGLIWNCRWCSENHVFMVSAEIVTTNTKTTQKLKMRKDREKLVKGLEKLVKRPLKTSTCGRILGWVFWSGVPYFHLWLCKQIDLHVVHLDLFRASVDWGSCSFLFSQRFNCFIAPNWGRSCPW